MEVRIVPCGTLKVKALEMIKPLSLEDIRARYDVDAEGNMKLAMNGAMTIGTLDGANVEILEEVGADNIFIFGLTEKEVSSLKNNGYNPNKYVKKSPVLQKVMNLIVTNFFCSDQPDLFRPIYDELNGKDEYFLMADFDAYLAGQAAVEKAYTDKFLWTKMSILNVARCGKFSSDRTIIEYAKDIWGIESVPISLTEENQ